MSESKRQYGNEFDNQRHNSKRRGISFEFTYDEWINWWGDDIVNKGRIFTEEHRKKLSHAMSKGVISEEYLQARSKAVKAWFEQNKETI